MNLRYDSSWQAVGISSDPAIKRDPVSLHMQNYLRWGSEHSKRHLVIVDDILQAYNYAAFHDWKYEDASVAVSQKGLKKTHDLSLVARAQGLENIHFARLSTVLRHGESIAQQVYALYHTDIQFRNRVQSSVPQRLADDACEKQRHFLAHYVLGESIVNLYLGGTRISSPKQVQRQVNDLASYIHKQYHLGNPISWVYPLELGQEWELGKKGKVEPYSAAYTERRILVTDSYPTLLKKSAQANPIERREFSQWLARTCGKRLHPLRALYLNEIQPSRHALRKDAVIRYAESIVLALTISATLLTGMYHHNLKAQEILSNPERSRALIEAVGRYR